MSADLFALFGDLSQTATPQQSQQNHQAQHQGTTTSNTTSVTPIPASTGDPFSFLASSTSVPQQQSTQWPPFQQSTQPAAQPSTWFAAAHEPQNSNGWGSLGSSGGLGGFQSQNVSFQTIQEPLRIEEDDDGWGDFEVAQTNQPPPSAAPTIATTAANPPRARVTRASTIDMMSNKLVDLGLEASIPEPWQHRPSWEREAKKQQPPKTARNPDPDVLFDADFEAENDLNEDDDFGDFETGTPAVAVSRPAPVSSALDLLSLDSTPAPPPKKQPPGLTLSNAALQANPTSYPEAPKSPYGTFQERKPEGVKQLQVKPPIVAKVLQEASEASPSPVTAWPTAEDDGFGNAWEEFTDLPDTSKPTPKSKLNPASTSTPAAAPDWDWQQDWGAAGDQPAPATQPPPKTQEPAPGPPPTNIPPPAILLSLFPRLLDLASSTLLKPLLTLSTSSPAHQRILASPQTLAFLQGYLALATVAARLIAGRKHRWHRDKFLAQAMSISAAPAGGAGQRGMKLTSVDRSQAAHEDREAAEVVAVWKRQVGRLRGVVAGVNAAAGQALRVPEVGPEGVGGGVRTVKGALAAPRACVVCGLKRDERVAKVDGEVEDSFGEWWVEFWGHRECRNFWVGHEKELRQR